MLIGHVFEKGYQQLLAPFISLKDKLRIEN